MPEPRELYQEALDAFASQDYEAAIAGYHRVIEADPRLALAYQGLAEAYARAGQLDEAAAAIREAIALEPEEALFHTSLSRIYQMQGRISEAEEAAATAQQLQNRRP